MGKRSAADKAANRTSVHFTLRDELKAECAKRRVSMEDALLEAYLLWKAAGDDKPTLGALPEKDNIMAAAQMVVADGDIRRISIVAKFLRLLTEII